MKKLALIALPMWCGSATAGPDFLVGIRESGDLVRIDLTTGAGTPLGGSGTRCGGAYGVRGTRFMGNAYDYLVTMGTAAPYTGHILVIDRWRGSIWRSTPLTGIPAGHTPMGFAVSDTSSFCILQPDDPQSPDLLAKQPFSASEWTIVGSTGRSDISCLIVFNQQLLALGTENGGALYSIDRETAAATLIGGGSFGGDVAAMCIGTGQQLLCCGANLRSINPLTGQTSLIGPIGFSDFTSLAFVPGNVCKAECDGYHHGLTPNDLFCFLNRFAAGDPWCNCDESTGDPLLTANDFMCILNEYASAQPGNCY